MACGTVFLLGFGAIHELIEWASTLALGPGRGMLKFRADDPFDTQEDLFNNLLGSILALTLYALPRKKSPPPTSSETGWSSCPLIISSPFRQLYISLLTRVTGFKLFSRDPMHAWSSQTLQLQTSDPPGNGRRKSACGFAPCLSARPDRRSR